MKKRVVVFILRNVRQHITVILLLVLFFLVYFSPGLMLYAPSEKGEGFVNFFTLTAGVLSGILALFIAVVILSFELTQKFHPDYSIKILFRNFNLRELFVLYLGTVIISGFAVLYEGNLSVTQQQNMAWLVFLLFLLAISVLFRYIKKIIVASRPNETIRELISAIDYMDIYATAGALPRDRTRLRSIGMNPLRVLAEGAEYSIKDGKGRYARIILAEITERLVSELEKTQDKRSALKGFLPIYQHIAEVAINQRDPATLLFLSDCFERIHFFSAEKKTQWSDLIELNEVFLEIFSQCAEKELEEVTAKALGALSRIAKYHLEFNCPPENKIWSLDMKNKKIKHDTNIELQWDHVSGKYSDMILSIISGSKEEKISRETAFTGISKLEWLISDVLELKNLGVKQKKHIIRWLLFQIIDNYLQLARMVPRYLPGGFPLSPHVIREIYSKYKDEEFISMYYEDLGNLMFELVKLKFLTPFRLNMIAAEARGFMRTVGTDPLADKCIIFTIGLFEKIAAYCSSRVGQPYFKEIFTECHFLLENLPKFGEKSPKKRALITRRLNRFMKKTKAAARYKRELESEKVSWSKITLRA